MQTGCETRQSSRPTQRSGKRLLMVTTIPRSLREFLLPYAREFAANGWQVDALANGATSCPECRQVFRHVWDAPWSRNPLDPSNLARAATAVRSAVEQGCYDIVHTHTPVASFVTRWALRRHRKQNNTRVIYSAHGFHFFSGGKLIRNTVFKMLERLAGRWTDYLVVMNSEDFTAAQRYHIVPAERLVFMPGIGVDPQRFSPEAVPPDEVIRVKASLSLAVEDPFFLMIAEFIPRKRHRDVLHAFARLGRSDAHLVLAGEGVLLPRMQLLANELGIANRMHFLGYRRDTPALIRASSAVILCSEQEGLPKSLMEALSMETPAIGTDIRGTHDLLVDGCGILTPLGHIERLTQAMAWVLEHPIEAKAMACRARSRIKERFSVSVIQRMHEELYARALLG